MYLLDTNIISEAKRPHPDRNVLDWLARQPLNNTFISVLSLGELEEGIALLGDTRKARDLRTWLGSLRSAYAGRILSVDQAVVSTWGQIRAHAKRQGKTVPVIDALLAATAITHELTLVTRNIKDVAALPVTTLNPFEVQS